jgi:hypothetical protein
MSNIERRICVLDVSVVRVINMNILKVWVFCKITFTFNGTFKVQKQRNTAIVVFDSEICHCSLFCFRMKPLNRKHFNSSTSFVESVFLYSWNRAWLPLKNSACKCYSTRVGSRQGAFGTPFSYFRVSEFK